MVCSKEERDNQIYSRKGNAMKTNESKELVRLKASDG